MPEAAEAVAAQTVATAAALLVGNELLSGKIEDRNLKPLAQMLRAQGIVLQGAAIVPDDVPRIASSLRAFSAENDVVFTSGGVGPTHDDVTLAAVAEAFQLPLDLHPELEAILRGVYGERCDDTHLRMGRVPRGAELKACEGVRWPTVVVRNVWVLPGVPELFRMKLLTARAHLRGPRPIFSRSVRVQLEETAITQYLDAVVAQFPSVEIGSYPKWFDPDCKTKVTFDAPDERLAAEACQALLEALPDGACAGDIEC